MEIRQRLIFPARLQTSIFSAEGLNFCVRNGNRWDPFVITTGNMKLFNGNIISPSVRLVKEKFWMIRIPTKAPPHISGTALGLFG